MFKIFYSRVYYKEYPEECAYVITYSCAFERSFQFFFSACIYEFDWFSESFTICEKKKR